MSYIDIPTDVVFTRGGKYGEQLCFRHAVQSITSEIEGEIAVYVTEWPSICVDCAKEKEAIA